jgi:hypothetical protein
MTEVEASSLEMLRKQMQYPLIKARALACGATPRLATPSITVRCARQNCDMPEEMRQDCVDLVITAIERFAGTPQSYEARSSAHAQRANSSSAACRHMHVHLTRGQPCVRPARGAEADEAHVGPPTHSPPTVPMRASLPL